MRPRLAILTMLAVGILFMGAGTGLAVSGLSGSEDAADVNYPTTTTVPSTTVPQGTVAGGAAGGTGGLQQAKQPEAQEVAQVAAAGDEGDSLPFTGFAAIPVIVVGVGLLVGGLVLRRRTMQ
jgi:hypothetical protein